MARNERFSPEVTRQLRAAGWFEGRSVAVDQRALPDEPVELALEVLREFGSLSIGGCGPGLERATCDVRIAAISPSCSIVEWRMLENQIGGRLDWIGDFHRHHGELAIDEAGAIYALSLVADEFEQIADSFPGALERLLLGLRWASQTRRHGH